MMCLDQSKYEGLARDFEVKSWFNPDPSIFMGTKDSGRDLVNDNAGIEFNLVDFSVEPKSFDDAFNHPNFEHRIKWREAISKELKEMFDKKVYEMVKKSELPNGWTYIKNKWVYKIKCNGIFRARLVASGNRQIPGVDFQESLPVVIDVIFRILPVAMTTWKLKAKFIDIETAFLHGNLKETILHGDFKGHES
jgi:hypothetical protein